MATFDEFITSLREEFGKQDAGRKFEVFCKWFLENDPQWSKRIDKVWLWDEYPNKWQRKDLGTDLVFSDNDGLIWAVQAKCYNEKYPTTKDDMNTFLADSGRKKVDKRLWLQTTNKMAKEASDTLMDQDKPVTVFNLSNFRDAEIDYPSSFSELCQAKVKDKPRPDRHQIEAIQAVKSKLKSLDRGQMIMACGTGKTFTTLWIKEELKAQTTLVLLPSLSLLSQTMREWAWAGNTDFEILNVCSDQSVGKKDVESMKTCDAPFPVTSEVPEIVKFLKKSGPRVLFCTYQSSKLISEAQSDKSVPTFDLVVADEAHRCAGKAKAEFATILDGDKIRANKRLFTTATPKYFGKPIKDTAKARDLAVVGMHNEVIFGPVVHELTFGEAIQRDLLTDYQVVIVGVDQPTVRQWIEDYEIVATNSNEQTDARTLAAKIGLIKAIKDYDLKRVISFHSRVREAKKFSEQLVDLVDLIDPDQRPEGKFLADYVSGEMKAGDRKEKIDKLKVLEGYDRGILTNARCLAEGVDVPSLDGVAFIDPKGSEVEIIQAVGRAIRKVRGAEVQTKGTIVIPVFIVDGDDPEASIEASNFKPVWDVLKALRAHDNELSKALDEYRTNMAKNASQNREKISDKVIFDIPLLVDVEFSNALRTVLVEASTDSWEVWFGLLEKVVLESGVARVPKTSTSKDLALLGSWIGRQRQHFKKGYLSTERVCRLELLPGWSWDPHNDIFWFGVEKCIEYFDLHGHLSPTVNTQNSEIMECGFRMGQWISVTRRDKDRLRKSEHDKYSTLEKLRGWIWDGKIDLWPKKYKALVNFCELNGHARPKATLTFQGIKLGGWVREQRYNREKLGSSKIIKLENLPKWSWDPHLDDLYEKFDCYMDYINEYKKYDVKQKIVHNGVHLGSFLNNVKNRKKSNTLRQEIIEKFETIPGWHWPDEQS